MKPYLLVSAFVLQFGIISVYEQLHLFIIPIIFHNSLRKRNIRCPPLIRREDATCFVQNFSINMFRIK